MCIRDRSLNPVYIVKKLEFDKDLVEYIWPNPVQERSVFLNDCVNYEVLFKENALNQDSKVQFKLSVAEIGAEEVLSELVVDMDVSQAKEDQVIHRAIAGKLVEKVEGNNERLGLEDVTVFYPNVNDLQERTNFVKKIALKYQVLSRECSAVPVQDEGVQKKGQLGEALITSDALNQQFMIRIIVRTLTEGDSVFYVNQTMTIKAVKELSVKFKTLPSSRLTLFYNGKQLEDQYTVKDYGLTYDSVLYLIPRLKGGDNKIEVKVYRRDQQTFLYEKVDKEMTCVQLRKALSDLTKIPFSEIMIKPDFFNKSEEKVGKLYVKDMCFLVHPKSFVTQKNFSDLERLVILQSEKGAWTNEQEVAAVLNIQIPPAPEVLTSKKPIGSSHLWWTLVVLHFLEKRFAKERGKWWLIAAKAETWLRLFDVSVPRYTIILNRLFESS
eukprot:TRINITY_DN24491_c0_g1_i1.p1 TRINITY_DN24491_c0_g1~~TRINITY_DN24491_c0_g1_i1.p1  ORF type:complete len:439 (+),score=94.92 TRINITY_DN24491_c0_g1_i1:64-1380(+)